MARQPSFLTTATDARALLFAVLLVVSVLLHAILLLIPFRWLFSDKPIQPLKHVVAVHRIARTQNERVRRRKLRQRLLEAKRRVLERKQKEKKKEERKERRQVVDVAPTEDDRQPKNARYVSEYNTNTKRETVSRHRRLKYRVAMSKVTTKRRARPQKARIASRGLSIQSRQEQQNNKDGRRSPKPRVAPNLTKSEQKEKISHLKRLRLPRLRKQRRLDLRQAPDGQYRHSRQTTPELRGRGRRLSLGIGRLKLELAKPQKDDPGERNNQPKAPGATGVPNVIDLRPDFGTLSRIQGAPAPDKVDAPEGDETALNTKAWRYASFMNRVKRLVAQHWNPATVYRRRDPYGNVYGVRDRNTILAIALDLNGSIFDIHVANSSGISFLDREAVRAVRAAQPFPNPPKALADADGKIRFRFGFNLVLSNRGLSIFR